ncbi:LOW QUALITY PROTEIN: PIF1-like protein [Mya arenaria]|uniref:PIF1-like protein n=1 Tax=Mya arenaria TaxID=6604 RepID=A0ABY7EP25_MYAAR|nr:LOW QUALITY PROTEIN: PIF1-like protein [Mya arenaria]
MCRAKAEKKDDNGHTFAESYQKHIVVNIVIIKQKNVQSPVFTCTCESDNNIGYEPDNLHVQHADLNTCNSSSNSFDLRPAQMLDKQLDTQLNSETHKQNEVKKDLQIDNPIFVTLNGYGIMKKCLSPAVISLGTRNYTLTTDTDFDALLNRIRKGKQIPQDIKTLQTRIIEPTDTYYNRQALRIFATNAETNRHNSERLRELGQHIVHLTRRERKSASLENFSAFDNAADTGGIVKTLELSKNDRVMIVRNIDVQDGLVNGAQGIIVDFLPNFNSVHNIFKKNGNAARASAPLDLSHYDQSVVPIKRVDVSFSTSSKRSAGLQITWTQFLLKLSFAYTIHKVQGLSVDQLVLSFQHKFSGGQAYVSLSRCRTLLGLQILHFDEKKITQSSSVKKKNDNTSTDNAIGKPFPRFTGTITICTIKLFKQSKTFTPANNRKPGPPPNTGKS